MLQLISLKLELRGALEAAYDLGDRVALRDIATTLTPATIAAVWEFDATFRRQWLACARPFGLERIQARNAALAARLEETGVRIREYLAGEIDAIEELETRLPLSAPVNRLYFYRHYSSGSCIN